MNDLQKKAIELLSCCTFVPGTNTKRFVSNMASVAKTKPEFELTPNQDKYLWELVWRFRRQHRNKWFTYYAKDKVCPEKPQPKINWVE